MSHWRYDLQVQLGLVICGRYVPIFWTANTEFADIKTADNEMYLQC